MPTVYLALIIPIIVTGIFYFFRKSEFAWWEFFIPIASVLVAVVISKAVIDHTSVQFTEWWGSSVTAVYEEEPYNYWDYETCTETYACGTDSEGNTEYCTRTYDCSHQDDVGPSWWAETNIKESFRISEKQHDELVRQFKTRRNVVDTHVNHSPRDHAVGSRGTKFEGKRVGEVSNVYKTVWNGSDDTRKAYVSQHSYENKIKASDLTIFNISVVTEEQVDSMKLFDYPEYKGGGLFSLTQGLEYPTILGGTPSADVQEKFRRLNGKFGVSNQMRLWVLVFENKPASIARYQENYWVGGNMNELVLCIGKRGNEIQWAHAFSWANSNELTIDVRDKVMNLYQYKDSVVKKQLPPVVSTITKSKNPAAVQYIDSTIQVKSPAYPVLTEKTWNELYVYLNENLNRFQRRTFEEFDYLTVKPSTGAIIFIFIFALVISIAINMWIINNEFWGDDEKVSWNGMKKIFKRKNTDYEY